MLWAGGGFMKKLLLILIPVLVVFCFAGCSSDSNKQTYTRIELNTENYDEYISLNFYYSDCQIVAIEESELISTCSIFAIANIETSKKKSTAFLKMLHYLIRPQISLGKYTGGETSQPNSI